jgi:hypothetical protein
MVVDAVATALIEASTEGAVVPELDNNAVELPALAVSDSESSAATVIVNVPVTGVPLIPEVVAEKGVTATVNV